MAIPKLDEGSLLRRTLIYVGTFVVGSIAFISLMSFVLVSIAKGVAAPPGATAADDDEPAAATTSPAAAATAPTKSAKPPKSRRRTPGSTAATPPAPARDKEKEE